MTVFLERGTKACFSEYLGVLRDCRVTRPGFEPLFCGVLLIRKPKDMKPDGTIASDWGVLSKHMGALCSRYRNDLGENAYAVFNAITEFASHPPENRCVHRDRHSFQRLAGDCLSRFSQECRQPGLAISDYLARLTKGNGNGGEAPNEKSAAMAWQQTIAQQFCDQYLRHFCRITVEMIIDISKTEEDGATKTQPPIGGRMTEEVEDCAWP